MAARVTTVPAAAQLLLLLTLLACVLSGGGDPAQSRIHFGGWSPLRSPRWQRPRSRPAPHCGRACQLERSKAQQCGRPPRDAGRRCGDQLVRYSYVAASNSCVPFLYGGCYGNANNFATFEQCRDRCKTAAAVPSKTFGGSKTFGVSKTVRRGGGRRGSGDFRPSVGGSRIHFGIGPRRGGGRGESGGVGPRFGGRRRGSAGLGSRFGGGRGSQSESVVSRRKGIFFPGPVATSRPARRPRTKSRGSCLRAPRQAGWPCREATVRYSYLRASNSCIPFEFRGCGGSSNSFSSFSECRDLCKTPPPPPPPAVGPRRSRGASRRCRQSWQAGPCRGFGPLMRYFYNDQRAACEMALYSGCGGNTNRFLSREACERTCLLG